jgi:hypothetical protein
LLAAVAVTASVFRISMPGGSGIAGTERALGPERALATEVTIRCVGRNRPGEPCLRDSNCASGLCRERSCVSVRNDCVLFGHNEVEEGTPNSRRRDEAFNAADEARRRLLAGTRVEDIARNGQPCPATLLEMDAGLRIGEVSRVINTRLGYILVVRHK